MPDKVPEATVLSSSSCPRAFWSIVAMPAQIHHTSVIGTKNSFTR